MGNNKQRDHRLPFQKKAVLSQGCYHSGMRGTGIMCLILVALNPMPGCKLLLAANRDEYYDRPTAPAGFWKEAPYLLAGKDLHAGGTWLGVTKTGRVAGITNYRDPSAVKKHAPSRGELVTRFLRLRAFPT